MAFEQTWRWFGPKDPFSLKEIKQTGASGIVTALHQIPVGEVWSMRDILARKEMIEAEGLTWSVVESVPVHENIKKRKKNYRKLIENYNLTIRNLGLCGIHTVCYNFMPVLDWSRTNLNVVFDDGSITSGFEIKAFSAFDLFILKRKDAEESYNDELIYSAKEYFDTLTEKQKEELKTTILYGLPGSLESYTLDEFNNALNEYKNIGHDELQNNLREFIREIISTAEESGVFLAIHPDDPPFPLLGLPRVVSGKADIESILNAKDSVFNGLTLCTGSLGAGYGNDILDITKTFASKINFVHLRNVSRNEAGDFREEDHLEGDIDIFNVMKTLLLEQKSRREYGRPNVRLPLRPDHGRLMIPDINRTGIYPGYSLFGRMRGLAELRGLEKGITLSMGI